MELSTLIRSVICTQCAVEIESVELSYNPVVLNHVIKSNHNLNFLKVVKDSYKLIEYSICSGCIQYLNTEASVTTEIQEVHKYLEVEDYDVTEFESVIEEEEEQEKVKMDTLNSSVLNEIAALLAIDDEDKLDEVLEVLDDAEAIIVMDEVDFTPTEPPVISSDIPVKVNSAYGQDLPMLKEISYAKWITPKPNNKPVTVVPQEFKINIVESIDELVVPVKEVPITIEIPNIVEVPVIVETPVVAEVAPKLADKRDRLTKLKAEYRVTDMMIAEATNKVIGLLSSKGRTTFTESELLDLDYISAKKLIDKLNLRPIVRKV